MKRLDYAFELYFPLINEMTNKSETIGMLQDKVFQRTYQRQSRCKKMRLYDTSEKREYQV